MAGLTKKCCNCRSELGEANASSASAAQCEKCRKNEEKYGKPTTCKYCQLPAAFHEEKCVYCSHSERKSGTPVACANCKLKCAFHKDARHKAQNKAILCRMCIVQARANKQGILAGVSVPTMKEQSSSSHRSSHKRRREEKKEKEEISKMAKKDPLTDNGENVLIVQQLKDQIARLNGIISAKDGMILEKDKKIAALNADLMSAEKKQREKFYQLMKDKDDAVQAVHDKYRKDSKLDKEKNRK